MADWSKMVDWSKTNWAAKIRFGSVGEAKNFFFAARGCFGPRAATIRLHSINKTHGSKRIGPQNSPWVRVEKQKKKFRCARLF